MGFVKETFSSGRDRASAALIGRLVEGYVRKYGRIENIVIDSSRKIVEAEILLNGEAESMTIRISRYEIIREEGHHKIVARGVSASREWIDAIARDFLEGRAIRIPSSIAKVLSFLA